MMLSASQRNIGLFIATAILIIIIALGAMTVFLSGIFWNWQSTESKTKSMMYAFGYITAALICVYSIARLRKIKTQ